MSLGALGVVGLVVYLGVLAVVAEVARRARADTSPSDHFLAGRSIGPVVLLLTLYATAYSGNSLLGYPGEAYRRGFVWVMSTGFMLAIIVAFHALVPRLRPLAVREGFVSPGDWIRHRFGHQPGGRVLVVAVALVMSIAVANFLLAQLIAMGTVTAQITGSLVPYWLGVVGLAAVILAYETLGGMRAVAWTDAVQGGVMLVALSAVCGRIVWEEGGLGGLTDAVAAVRPEAVAVPTLGECTNWASTIVLLGLASVVYPQMIQRIYAARDGRTLKRSLAMMTFMPLVTTTVVALIGLAAIPRFRGLGDVAADRVMPLLLTEWAGGGTLMTGLVVLVFMGALAAIMSTADSVLLALGSLIAEDLLGRSGRDAATTRLGKRAAAAVMAVAVVLALAPRLTLWRLIELKMELLIQCAPAFLLALHWPGLRARTVLAGLVAGTAVAAAGALTGVARLGGVHVGVIGLGVNVVVVWLGAAGATPRRLALGAVLVTLAASCGPGSLVRHGALQEDALQEVRARTATARGLSFDAPVPARALDAGAFVAALTAEIDQGYPPGDLERVERVQRALGLLPAGMSLRPSLQRLLGGQVAAYYDPRTKTLTLATDSLEVEALGLRLVTALTGHDLVGELLVSHELVHALQDQHWPLPVEPEPVTDAHSDALVARRAVLEGDATLASFAVVAGGDIDADQVARVEEELGDLDLASDYPDVPAVLRESLAFQYRDGVGFVAQALARGGWAAVDAVQADPPASTEQVLHPERYFGARDLPITVVLGGSEALEAEGWTRIVEDTLGELDTRTLLRRTQPTPAARRIAAGWGGDRLRALARGDALLVVWMTAWDTPEDAAEFAEALPGVLPAARVERRGPRVLVMLGPGDEALAARVWERTRFAPAGAKRALTPRRTSTAGRGAGAACST